MSSPELATRIFNLFQRLPRPRRRLASAQRLVPILSGSVLFCLLFSGCCTFCLGFGFDPVVIGAVLLVAGLGLVGSIAWATRAASSRSSVAWAWLILGIWGFATPWITTQTDAWSTHFTQQTWTHPGLRLLTLLMLGGTTLLPIVWCLGQIAWHTTSTARDRRSLLLGGVGMCLILPWLGSSVWNLGLFAGAASAGSLVLALWSWARPHHLESEAEAKAEPLRESPIALVLPIRFFAAFATGLLLPVMFHMLHQTVATSLFTLCCLWSGVLAGAWLGAGFGHRLDHRISGTPLLVLALWSLGVWIVFPWLISTQLLLTVRMSHVALLYTARGLLLGLAVLPAGWLLQDVVSSRRADSSQAIGLLLLGLGGGLLGLWGTWSPGTLTLTLGIAALVALWALNLHQLTQPGLATTRLTCGLVTAALVIGLGTSSGYRPETAERLLFSSQTFAAYRSGMAESWLPHLDDGRLLAEYDSVQGRWSLWRHRANQTLVRRDGIAVGLSAPFAAAGPLSPVEVMPVALPLSLAVQPDHVLLLGMTSPTPLATALHYPVRSVTVVEESSTATAIAQRLDELAGGISFADDRVQLVRTTPQLAVLGQSEQAYDVIVCTSPHVSRLQNQPLITAEFYRNAASRLSADGLFCQRLAYFDLGPEMLRDVAATLASVFPHVAVTELTQGELLFVAANTPQELAHSGVIDQLKAPHSRRVLSEIGWDWSVAMSLGTVVPDRINELAAGGRTNSTSNGRFAWSLPYEVARWGDKAQATRQLLAKCGNALGAGLGDIPEAQDISLRLEDVRQKYVLAVEHPDEYWAYRAVIKKRLQDRPRTEIVQVRHEGLKRALHTEDARRKEYLQQLGDLAKFEHPTGEQIEALARFAEPYDPLVSDFVHFEAAHQYARATNAQPRDAYQHWLHSVMFAPPQDRSVRTVCAALQMLNQFPETTPSASERFDHLNALLEVMEQRWVTRLTSSDRSKYEVIDTERSIQAVEESIATMQQLASHVPVSETDWNLRKEVLAETLLRPLKAERSRQMRQYSVPATPLAHE
ncbi:MAG: hypothetical protein KDA58_04455 [Planctomycetaceae bacterium]|nr:hypothetical protein [Planctomycetaceae bacterium]